MASVARMPTCITTRGRLRADQQPAPVEPIRQRAAVEPEPHHAQPAGRREQPHQDDPRPGVRMLLKPEDLRDQLQRERALHQHEAAEQQREVAIAQ